MWIILFGVLFASDTQSAQGVMKIRHSDSYTVRLWGVLDGERYATTSGLGIAGEVDYYQGKRPKLEHLSATVVVLMPKKNGFEEIVSQECKISLPPNDETKVEYLTNISAESGWPPGPAIVRVFFYDKSQTKVIQRASDTKYLTFVRD